jgi:DedD protein
MAAAKPVPVPKPAPTPVAPLPPKPEVAVAKPAPAPVVKPEPAKPVATKPEPAKPAGKERWSVQVGSYADLTNARTAESKLKAAGLPTQFGPVDTAKGVLYRVRVGPLADEAAAQAAKAKTAQLGFTGANVRRD